MKFLTSETKARKIFLSDMWRRDNVRPHIHSRAAPWWFQVHLPRFAVLMEINLLLCQLTFRRKSTGFCFYQIQSSSYWGTQQGGMTLVHSLMLKIPSLWVTGLRMNRWSFLLSLLRSCARPLTTVYSLTALQGIKVLITTRSNSECLRWGNKPQVISKLRLRWGKHISNTDKASRKQ